MNDYKEEIRGRIEALERRLNRVLTEQEFGEIRRKCAGRVERYLDAGHGKCTLKNPLAASVVQKAFQLYASVRYELDAWCVVPNHAHAIVSPANGWALEKITYDWKHCSAVFINRAIGRRGSLWQSESFDHLIRSDNHLERFRTYVLANPSMAGLSDWGFVGIG